MMTVETPTQMGASNNYNNGGFITKRFNNNKKGGGGGKGVPKGNRAGKGKGFTRKMTESSMKEIFVSSDSGIPIAGQ